MVQYNSCAAWRLFEVVLTGEFAIRDLNLMPQMFHSYGKHVPQAGVRTAFLSSARVARTKGRTPRLRRGTRTQPPANASEQTQAQTAGEGDDCITIKDPGEVCNNIAERTQAQVDDEGDNIILIEEATATIEELPAANEDDTFHLNLRMGRLRNFQQRWEQPSFSQKR